MQYKTLVIIIFVVVLILGLGFLYLEYGDNLFKDKKIIIEDSEMVDIRDKNNNDSQINDRYGKDKEKDNTTITEDQGVWNGTDEIYNEPYEDRTFTGSEFK